MYPTPNLFINKWYYKSINDEVVMMVGFHDNLFINNFYIHTMYIIEVISQNTDCPPKKIKIGL